MSTLAIGANRLTVGIHEDLLNIEYVYDSYFDPHQCNVMHSL
jgi:hypothetical protein